MIRWVRLAAVAKTLRLSPLEALPLVIQAAVKPCFSRSSMAARAVLRSAAVTAVVPGEISRPPREWAERSYNVCRWTEMARGGHFAALEEPELLAEDVRSFFRAYRTTGTLGQPVA